MARCSACRRRVLSGVVGADGQVYCSDDCAGEQSVGAQAMAIPRSAVQPRLLTLHQGRCPRCKGPGPVDVHAYHEIWSLVLLGSMTSQHILACRRCGRRTQLGALLKSLLFGWWSVPRGVLLTPIQIGRNLAGIFDPPPPDRPSGALERHVREQMVALGLHHEHASATDREARRAKARRGQLSREERVAVLQESLAPFETLAAQRAATTHFDGRSLLLVWGTLASPFAGLALGQAFVGRGGEHIAELGMWAFGIGTALTVHAFATEPARFVRRQLLPGIRDALKPFFPSHEELDALAESMRASDWTLGKRLDVEALKQALHHV